LTTALNRHRGVGSPQKKKKRDAKPGYSWPVVPWKRTEGEEGFYSTAKKGTERASVSLYPSQEKKVPVRVEPPWVHRRGLSTETGEGKNAR